MGLWEVVLFRSCLRLWLEARRSSLGRWDLGLGAVCADRSRFLSLLGLVVGETAFLDDCHPH